MKTLIAHFLWYTGIPSLSRRLFAQKGRFVLMFHGVAARNYQEIPRGIQPNLTAEDLRLILTWVQERFFFLTPESFLETNEPGVLLTFDDGFANNVTNALPVLEQFQAPAIYFTTVQHIANPKNWLPATKKAVKQFWPSDAEIPPHMAQDFLNGMSIEQLQWCARHPLITIGSHTISHPFLTQCTSAQLVFELQESKRWLEEHTQQSIDLFAYPTGDYNRHVAEAVRDAGYRAAFVMDTVEVGLPSYEIPRIGLYEANIAYLSLKLSGLHRRPLLTSIRPQVPIRSKA